MADLHYFGGPDVPDEQYLATDPDSEEYRTSMGDLWADLLRRWKASG